MTRAVNRLTARKVQTLTESGRHADGGGLYLVVDPSGAKRWVMLYRFAGKRREMGLGPVLSVPLIRARELAAEVRAKIAEGRDPVGEKHAAASAPAPAAPISFADVALAFMSDREATWRNAKHRAQWRSTLENQASTIWSMPVADVSTNDVLAVLRPLWHTKAETARRIRGRIEAVLDAARAGGHRGVENPARWRGHLDKLLPKSKKLQRGHHAAMPYADVPALYAGLRARAAPSAEAMRLLILTAARSGEIRGIRRSEVDLANALWTVPAERMKAGRPHRVPLVAEAVSILTKRCKGLEPDALLYQTRNGTAWSDMVFTMLMRRMKADDYTPHGFRSSFRDWVDEATDFSGDIAEAALAHLTGDETERAYRRGDALAKRRHLMEAWAAFVASVKEAPSSSLANSS